MRFYMIPGFGHGFGPFNAKFDSLRALQKWVEKGQAPSGLTAVDGNPNAGRSRPICEWPKWPKFTARPAPRTAPRASAARHPDFWPRFVRAGSTRASRARAAT